VFHRTLRTTFACVAIALLCLAAPVHAAVNTYTDAVGDASPPGLDITRVTETVSPSTLTIDGEHAAVIPNGTFVLALVQFIETSTSGQTVGIKQAAYSFIFSSCCGANVSYSRSEGGRVVDHRWLSATGSQASGAHLHLTVARVAGDSQATCTSVSYWVNAGSAAAQYADQLGTPSNPLATDCAFGASSLSFTHSSPAGSIILPIGCLAAAILVRRRRPA
jgi:hypothetical protein